MTLSTAKKMIRLALHYGMSKNNAFTMADRILIEEHNEKLSELDRFRYEINAEEQRQRS